MKSSLIWLSLVALSWGSAIPDTAEAEADAAALAAPKKVLTFDCSSSQVGDVCKNMCYGATCKKFGTSLTWDKPSASTKNKRRNSAGCGSGNRCSKSPYGKGYQCDEYPFASTKQADKGNQVNRCVLSRYNSRQGSILRNFYYSTGSFKGKGCNKKAPCKFSIGFKNASKMQYCKKKPSCKNDGNEYTRRGPAKRDDESVGGYYRLAGGDVIYVPEGAQVGDLVYQTTFTNTTLSLDDDVSVAADVEDVDADDEGQEQATEDGFEVQEDRIVEEVADWS